MSEYQKMQRLLEHLKSKMEYHEEAAASYSELLDSAQEAFFDSEETSWTA